MQNEQSALNNVEAADNSKDQVKDKVIQTLVMRTRFTYPDGQTRKPRTGKIVAQGAHASMAFLSHRVREAAEQTELRHHKDDGSVLIAGVVLSVEEREWLLNGAFTKITLGVSTEEELITVYEASKAAGLTAHLIVDSGLTEFGGTPTPTGVGIGPHYKSRIDPITRHLELI